MRSGLLLGREHTRLGAVAALSEGRCAIALSRGGFRKGYAHRDPNEDAAAFAFGAGGALLAVADGHGGHEAADLALSEALARFAPAWTGAGAIAAGWSDLARDALGRLHTEVIARGSSGGNPEARTTLALAIARPDEGVVLFASVGDSHVFAAGRDGAPDLAAQRDARPAYLGSSSLEPAELAARAAIGRAPLAETHALVLATDGLSEEGIGVDAPEHTVLEALAHARRASRELHPLELARGIVDRALDSHRSRRSGDNVASAVLCLDV